MIEYDVAIHSRHEEPEGGWSARASAWNPETCTTIVVLPRTRAATYSNAADLVAMAIDTYQQGLETDES